MTIYQTIFTRIFHQISRNNRIGREEELIDSLSLIGFQMKFTKDNLQMRSGASKRVTTPITQTETLSLISSVLDPVTLFAVFCVHICRIFKRVFGLKTGSTGIML